GPVGTVIGAIAGAAGGWWSGKAAADAASNIDATDDNYYRQRFSETGGRDYDTARPAYHLGHVAGFNPDYEGRSFEEVEPDLRRGWTSAGTDNWDNVRDYARDAFEHGQERRLTLAEEQLAVGKRTVQEGEVALRKHVDTRHVEEQVELVREEVTVERRPLSADPANANISDIGEEEIRVPVMREEAVVEKRTVPIEEVVVRKEAVADTQKVAADLRKETLDVDENIDTKRTRTTNRNVDETTDRL
ncbi:MAG TPA: YsnF/AvaK domain-containing protein, partial [Gemmatimonadaceae bacterium]|nr:YsnF/AvaK domain-containing protein [Gemmatimonadaceae bacterium]